MKLCHRLHSDRWIILSVLLACCCAWSVQAAENGYVSLVGRWNFNSEQMKYPPGKPAPAADPWEITADDGKQLAFVVFSTTKEGLKPVAHYKGKWDGTKYPYVADMTMSFKRTSSTSYYSEVWMKGALIITESVTLEGGGNKMRIRGRDIAGADTTDKAPGSTTGYEYELVYDRVPS